MASGPATTVWRSARRSLRIYGYVGHPVLLWGGFLIVHLVLVILCITGANLPLGDVTLVYKPWAQQAQAGQIVGIDGPWVYPIVAIIPILVPLLVGLAHYEGGWIAMVLALNAVAFAVLTTRGGRYRFAAAWWWLAFMLLLGPVALGRLDAVSLAIVIVAIVWLRQRPLVAATLLAIATWIKVWPIAIIAGLVIATRERFRVVFALLATSLVVVILAIGFGGGANVFSFVSQQTGRGLQIEAPISTIWMWETAVGRPGSTIYYDQNILTFQVTGDGINTAIALMNPLLAVAVVAVMLLGVWASYRKAPALRVLPALSLAIVATLIAFNKVGSPQYLDWLAAPVILGVLCQGRSWRVPAILVGVTAALTQLIYPYLYNYILVADPLMLSVLTLRNAMFFVVLGWAVVELWRAARVRDSLEETADAPSVWPFARPGLEE